MASFYSSTLSRIGLEICLYPALEIRVGYELHKKSECNLSIAQQVRTPAENSVGVRKGYDEADMSPGANGLEANIELFAN